MMQAIDFACVMEHITKKLDIVMDSDITAKIFDTYEKICSYENYTLLELIGLCRELKIPIACEWNKKAIIKMIVDKNIDIPPHFEPMQATMFEHHTVRSLDVLDTKHMEFYDGRTIQFADGKIYKIIDIEANYELISEDLDDYDDRNYRSIIDIWFENFETKEESIMSAEDFIYHLDNEDVTIL